MYTATKTNPYKSQIDTEAVASTEQATEQIERDETRREQEIAQKGEQEVPQQQSANSDRTDIEKSTGKDNSENSDSDSEKTDEPSKQDAVMKEEQEEVPASEQNKWPWKNATLHPLIANMPASAETSIKSVAQYIAEREKDPVLRIKALHDYVADRIAYDHVAYYTHTYPDQSSRTVFKTRKGVCAGYANLLCALASAIGEKIVVVVGDSRDSAAGDKLAGGGGHAWNAACINGKWYPLDATWDAGNTSRERGFEKAYRTEYLLTPPEVMIQSHFPESEKWQLLDHPLSIGEFLRQPMLDPSFLASHLTLIRPTRAVNETDSNAVVIVKNPDQKWLMVGLEQDGREIGTVSDPNNEKYAKLERQLPGKGRYRLKMYANREDKYGPYQYVGSLDYVNR